MKKFISTIIFALCAVFTFAQTNEIDSESFSTDMTNYTGIGIGGFYSLQNVKDTNHNIAGPTVASIKDVMVNNSNGLSILFGVDFGLAFNKDFFGEKTLGGNLLLDIGIGKAFVQTENNIFAMFVVFGGEFFDFSKDDYKTSFNTTLSTVTGGDSWNISTAFAGFETGLDFFYQHNGNNNLGFYIDVKGVFTFGDTEDIYKKTYNAGKLTYRESFETIGFEVIPTFGISFKI